MLPPLSLFLVIDACLPWKIRLNAHEIKISAPKNFLPVFGSEVNVF